MAWSKPKNRHWQLIRTPAEAECHQLHEMWPRKALCYSLSQKGGICCRQPVNQMAILSRCVRKFQVAIPATQVAIYPAKKSRWAWKPYLNIFETLLAWSVARLVSLEWFRPLQCPKLLLKTRLTSLFRFCMQCKDGLVGYYSAIFHVWP